MPQVIDYMICKRINVYYKVCIKINLYVYMPRREHVCVHSAPVSKMVEKFEIYLKSQENQILKI